MADLKKELNSKVTEVYDDYIKLDKTIFFPGGGGQPNDLGQINVNNNSIDILKVSWKDGDIAHLIDPNQIIDIKSGDSVEIKSAAALIIVS